MATPATNIQKLAYSINEFADTSSLGRNKIYGAIKEGRLKARKDRGRTIILVNDGMSYLESLPALEVAVK